LGWFAGSPEQLGEKVPASPDWSVRDVVAHVTGVASDAAHGRIPPDLDLVRALLDSAQAGIRDALTADQVESRTGHSLEEILTEWDEVLREVLPMIRGERPFPRSVPFVDAALVTDLATHSQDIRNALGMPGERESAGVSIAFVSYATTLGLRLAQNGVPPLRLEYGGKGRLTGEGAPGATVSADRYELYRALAGRRSADQIRALDWEGDPEPYLDLIPAYGPRMDSVIE
jgi:uncharacterized protein (TIGR03083 family)